MKTEADVKKEVKKVLAAFPDLFSYMPVSNGMGVMGIPDFVCSHKGRFIGIETKRPGRRGEANSGLSGLQVRIKSLIESSGGLYCVVDDEVSVFALKKMLEGM